METSFGRIASWSLAGPDLLNLGDFVWDLHERPSAKIASNGDLPIPAFPEVDLSLPDDTLVPLLHSAASSWGFFRIVSHGIPQALLDSVASHSLRFFALSSVDKVKIARSPPVPYGYTSIRESSIIKSWSESLHLMPGEDRIRGLFEQVPSFQDGPRFSESIIEYFSLVGALSKRLITLLFRGLMVEEDGVRLIFNSLDSSTLRINHYPACPVADLTYGSPAHKDFGGIAILYQDDVGGLEVLKDGRWVAVKPKKGCLIVNIGNLIQVVSNGKYQSILHRSLVNISQPRLSFVFFHFPSDDTVLAPESTLVTEDNPAKYRPFQMREYTSVFGRAKKANISPLVFFEEGNQSIS